MPRLPTLRTRVLQELARQLRFESADAARRHLGRAEELAMQLLRESGQTDAPPPAAYPEEWVVFRITGLRMEPGGSGGDGGSVVREALLGDLPALIDRLSAAGKLTGRERGDEEDRENAPGAGGQAVGGKGAGARWLSVQELCARWKVNRKTLERYRRLGLASRRVGAGGGRERVVYGEMFVREFERVHALRVREAGAFERMDERTRERIVRRAERYRAKLGWTKHRCAMRIAAREGKSVEGVRRVLEKHDEEAERPLFDEPPPLDSEQRAWIERTARRGGSMSGAAARVRKSRATVYRVVGDRRAARLRELDLRGPVGPMFEREDAEDVILGHAAAREGLGRAGAASVGELLRRASAVEPEPTAYEQARAVAYWYLVWSARSGVEELPRHGVRVRGAAKGAGNRSGRSERAVIDVIETRLLWASRIKAEMVRSQLPLLVRAIESQTGHAAGTIPGSALRELCEVGLEALIDGVERFDPFKGGRLASPAGLGVTRAVSQWMRNGRERLGPPTRAAAKTDLEALALEDWTARIHPWQQWIDAPRGVRARVGELGERERRVLEMRFGWSGVARTIGETAATIGITPTRVAAIQRRAVARLAFGAAPPGKSGKGRKGGRT